MNLDQIREQVAEVTGAAGYELVDLEVKGAGNQRVLRIFIDRETGISHLDCERVSREVGTILDVEDLIPFSYTLEVSSPGLDRKLTRPEDYRRFAGHRIRIRTTRPLGNQKTFLGRLDGLEGGRISLTVDPDRPVEIPLDAVREARLEVDWESELHSARSR